MTEVSLHLRASLPAERGEATRPRAGLECSETDRRGTLARGKWSKRERLDESTGRDAIG